MASVKIFSQSELAAHNSVETGAWVAIDGTVYDVTSFLADHPGGKKILLGAAGTDASKKFWKFHNKSVLQKTAIKFRIGYLEGYAPGGEAKAGSEGTKEGALGSRQSKGFGDMVPYGGDNASQSLVM